MSIFARLFSRKPKQQNVTRLEVTGAPATFTSFSASPWESDVYRSAVDAIARIGAKIVLRPTVTFSDGTKADADERLARLLQVQPNGLMSAYDMLYQLIAHLYVHNNSYLYVQRDAGQVVALWPLHVTSCELATSRDGQVLAAMTFANGRTTFLPYADVIHLKRHLNSRDVMGDGNAPIAQGIALANAQNEGITRSIAQGAQVRGIVKYATTLGASQLAEYKAYFEETQLNGNSTGVIYGTPEAEFIPVKDTTPTINADDMAEARHKIFSYLGVSESIVDGSFSDDEFGAFDESTIEALAMQMELEFTRKVYTPLQVARGRRIEASTARIRFIGIEHRNQLVADILPMGVLSVNEGRDVLGLPPIEGGERYIQSLNYADVEIVDDLQEMRQYIRARKDGTLPVQLAEEGADDEQG